VRQLLGEGGAGALSFDAVLQMATTLALVVYFWKDILRLLHVAWKMFRRKPVENKDRTYIWVIVFGTIPAVIFGLLLEKYMDTVFRSVNLVALTLILGSGLFWLAQKFGTQNKKLTLGRGIVIGFFQCLALVPGVSRSGATISGGLLTGLSRDEAVRFSFLLSIPVLLGAGLKKLLEVRSILTGDFGFSLLLGCITAFVTGLLAINFLIKYLKKHNLNVFIWYRIILAIILLIAVN
jgi:undecaprenyl-diphosphatase